MTAPARHALLATCLAALCAAAGCTSTGPQIWSIGIYAGSAPTDLAPHPDAKNPVLTAGDVTDVPAQFVADPFMVCDNGTWHMFFEVMNTRTRQGDIGLATSDDGLRWRYRRIVLDEPFHLSYPCVFRCADAIYMVPETHQAGAVRLYRAERFPERWSFVGVLLTGGWLDPTVFAHDGRWWMFASGGDATLYLFCAERPEGPWRMHPRSPVVTGDAHRARPGGRVVTHDGRLLRWAQDDLPTYGRRVRAFEIVRLTTEDDEEREVTDVTTPGATGRGWNAEGMHHVDAQRLSDGRWIACVDGCRLQRPGR